MKYLLLGILFTTYIYTLAYGLSYFIAKGWKTGSKQ